MDIEKLLRPIANAQLRDQLRTFISTGEASDKFLDQLDETPEYQKIVDEAFRMQATQLERFAARLQPAEPVARTPARVATAS